MALIPDPENRFWRTDSKIGRNIYALLSNDPKRPSAHDPFIGVMESSALAEEVVDIHNGAILKFGKRYRQILRDHEQ